MRCIPLAIWAAGRPLQELTEAVEADCRLTHSNKSVVEAVTCYVVAVASLIARPGDRQYAIA